MNDPNGNHTKASDYFIENGSYFRCNRITLGYTFDKSLISKAHIESLRLYLGVKNPFTITGYSMFDPQVPKQWFYFKPRSRRSILLFSQVIPIG